MNVSRDVVLQMGWGGCGGVTHHPHTHPSRPHPLHTTLSFWWRMCVPGVCLWCVCVLPLSLSHLMLLGLPVVSNIAVICRTTYTYSNTLICRVYTLALRLLISSEIPAAHKRWHICIYWDRFELPTSFFLYTAMPRRYIKFGVFVCVVYWLSWPVNHL